METDYFDFGFINNCRIEISNYGRLKTFNKVSNGNIIKGSLVNGYKIIRLKFYKEREEQVQIRLNYLQKQVLQLSQKINQLKISAGVHNGEDESKLSCRKELGDTSRLLAKLKESISKKFAEDLKSRTIHYQALVHRLVAEFFINQPSPEHCIVAHLDYNKLNNNKHNLKWMTPGENYLHQRFNPLVIASKTYLDGRRKEDAPSTKLSVTKVMLLKKLIKAGKPTRQLVKQFKVTDTQILRIKRGENWGEVKAAT